jgi:hypothetical protein
MTEDPLTPISRTPFPSGRQMKWLLALLLAYFSVRLLFFAVAIAYYVPPDEVTHLGLIQIFSKVLLLPDNTPETYQYGLVTNVSWLYYWVMGKLLLLNVFGLSDLLFLRLLNLPLAFATVYFAWRMLRLLTDDRLSQLLLIVVMTNTLMFSFLSATISYDNLANLFAVMAIYYLLVFFKEKSGNHLALSLACQLAGCLTKLSFLPLALILNLLLISREYRGLRNVPTAVRSYCKESGRRGLVLLFAILVGLILNLQLYLGNYIQYGQVKPDMADVVSTENAMQYRISARYIIFDLFKEGRVNYDQAIRMTSSIRHEGDRAGAVYLIQNYRNRQYRGDELLGPLEYVLPWGQRMLATVYGVMGHLSMSNNYPVILPILVLFILAGFAFLLRWRAKEAAGLPLILAVTCGAYAIFIMYFVNYRNYLYSESLSVALQGRYIFPVIGAFYVLFSFYLVQLFKGERARLVVALAAALVFILSDFPFFLYHVTPSWFAAFPKF